MHKPRNAAPIFRFHRQNVSVSPHGDDRILQVFLHSCGMNHLVQLFLDPVLRPPQVPPDVHQLAGSPVCDLVFAQDRVCNILFQVPCREKPFRLSSKNRGILPLRHQCVPCCPRSPQKRRHIQQHPRAQRSAFLADAQRRPHVRKRCHRVPADVLQNHRGLFRLGLGRKHRLQVVQRHKRPAFFRPGLGQGALRQHLPDPGKFQHPHRPFTNHNSNPVFPKPS